MHFNVFFSNNHLLARTLVSPQESNCKSENNNRNVAILFNPPTHRTGLRSNILQAQISTKSSRHTKHGTKLRVALDQQIPSVPRNTCQFLDSTPAVLQSTANGRSPQAARSNVVRRITAAGRNHEGMFVRFSYR